MPTTTNLEEFSKDELDPPKWMNKKFFTKVLRESEHDPSIEVKEFKLSPATMKGDHFASIMFRVGVEYQQKKGANKTKSLIIKTMPEFEGNKKDMLSDSHIFEVEIGMYTEVLPRFEKILRDLGDETVLKVHCLYHSLSPNKVMIFEDIVPQGYTVLRDRLMNMEEAESALLKLAKWQAISYKLIKEEPQYFAEYRHSMMSDPAVSNDDFMANGIKLFNEMLNTVPSLHKYIPYFKAMKANLLKKCIASHLEYFENPQANAFYVLCHGDFHSKNMMFKNNPKTGKFEDVMLLDFQLSYVGPIVNDLIYAIYMLMDAELRTKHLNELLYYYFTNFIETLKKLKYEGELPKLMEFQKQLAQNKHFEIFLVVTFLPMWYAATMENVDLDDIMSSADCRRATYQNKEYIADIEKILQRYLHLGYLEN